MRLQRKGVISQDVASRISAATNEEDGQGEVTCSVCSACVVILYCINVHYTINVT